MASCMGSGASMVSVQPTASTVATVVFRHGAGSTSVCFSTISLPLRSHAAVRVEVRARTERERPETV